MKLAKFLGFATTAVAVIAAAETPVIAGPVLMPIVVCEPAVPNELCNHPAAYCVPTDETQHCRMVTALCGFRDPSAPACVPVELPLGGDVKEFGLEGGVGDLPRIEDVQWGTSLRDSFTDLAAASNIEAQVVTGAWDKAANQNVQADALWQILMPTPSRLPFPMHTSGNSISGVADWCGTAPTVRSGLAPPQPSWLEPIYRIQSLMDRPTASRIAASMDYNNATTENNYVSVEDIHKAITRFPVCRSTHSDVLEIDPTFLTMEHNYRAVAHAKIPVMTSPITRPDIQSLLNGSGWFINSTQGYDIGIREVSTVPVSMSASAFGHGQIFSPMDSPHLADFSYCDPGICAKIQLAPGCDCECGVITCMGVAD